MKKLIHIAEITAYAILALCIVAAAICTTENELSGVLILSMIGFMTILFLNFFRRERGYDENVLSIYVSSMLFLMVTFATALKVKTLVFNGYIVEEQAELIQDYDNYYKATEELLDSIAPDSSDIYKTDAGIHYLNNKQSVDNWFEQ